MKDRWVTEVTVEEDELRASVRTADGTDDEVYIECHFDNSADSRHEMNLGSYEGLMLGGDVLSAPPGVAIVIPGDWANSKLRERLRNNRMPPGWEFDIEEGNRNGPVIIAGSPAEAVAEATPTLEAVAAAPVEPTTASTAPACSGLM